MWRRKYWNEEENLLSFLMLYLKIANGLNRWLCHKIEPSDLVT